MLQRHLPAFLFAVAFAIGGCSEETKYITQFEDIAPGPDSICVEGGVRLLAGFDVNADASLQPNEVDRMDNVCNGMRVTGPTGLLRVDELPVGGRCLNGGAVVFSGEDANSNGVLDDAEIMDTTFVCNGTNVIPAFEACETEDPALVRSGTIVVTTEAELAALEGVRCIRGNLVIDGYPANSIESLHDLVAVTNDLLVINSRTLDTVAGLRSLRVVGGNFLLQNNASLTSLDGFDMLEDVVLRFSLAGLGITDLTGLETFVNFTGKIEILGNDNLTSLHGLENLRQVGHVVVDNNDSLTTLGALDGLEHATGNVQIYRNDLITNVALAGLQRVDGVFDVFESPGVTTINVPNLLLPGQIRIRDNEHLISTEFPNVVVVAGIVEYMRNERLTTVRFPRLGYTSGSFYFLTNVALTEVTAPQLTTVGAQLYFRENAALPNFNGLGSLRTLGTDLGILDNDLIVDMTGLESLEVINGSFYVDLNTGLSSFHGFEALRIVRNKFEVKTNPHLCEPAIMDLQSHLTIGGDTEISGNCTAM